MNNWLKALKQWNEKNEKYIIPKKGTAKYDEVKKIQHKFDQQKGGMKIPDKQILIKMPKIAKLQRGGNPLMIAQAAAAAAPAIAEGVGKVVDFASELNKTGFQARQEAGKYEYINQKRERKDRAKDMKQFAKFKKLMEKGKFPQMTDSELMDYVSK